MPTAIIAAIGIGIGLVGMSEQKKASEQAASAQQDQIQQEQAIEAQKQKQMDLEYQREQKQALRNSIRARAVSLATATHQGAQFGSVLQGAYGQISGEYNTQTLANSQNYQIGQNIFGLNSNISNDKIAYSQAMAQYQQGAALTSLGGMFVQNAATIGRVGSSSYAALGRGMSFGTGPSSYGMGNNYRTS